MSISGFLITVFIRLLFWFNYHDTFPESHDNVVTVPADVFTNDDQTSYDTYNPAVIDLTQPIEQIDDNTVIDLRDNSGSKNCSQLKYFSRV